MGKLALLRNLYLDLSFLFPFKNRKKEAETPKFVESKAQPAKQPVRELPEVSRRLLSQADTGLQGNLPRQLPIIKVEPPRPLPLKTEQRHISAPVQADIGQSEEKADLSVPRAGLALQRPDQDDISQSFFSNLYTHIAKEDTLIHSNASKEILYKNLFDEMKEFWQDKKEGIQKEFLDKTIKADLARKILELKGLEIEWQNLKSQSEKLNGELASKELVIENDIKQIKNAFKRMHLNMSLRPEHYFVLCNGEKLRSLGELGESLKYLDENAFNYHVNSSKNDFAAWVNDIFGLPDLAQNMRNVKNREQMADLIDLWHKSI